jgi:predicted component of type VI protein secretion system
MRLGSRRQVTGLPLHVYREDGEEVLKPCAEALMTEKEAEFLMEEGVMPLASLKGQDSALLVRFQSAGKSLAALRGRWR